jgi:hypothetical protein
MRGRPPVAILFLGLLTVCCAETSDERGAAGRGETGGDGATSGGGTSGGASGAGGTAASGGTAGAGGNQEAAGAGGGGADDVCSGYPADCFPLCEGGLCECYCESAGGSGGAGAGGGPAAGEGGTGAVSGGGASAGSGGSGTVDCDCVRGGYAPVCGVDGTTYDAICGVECVPVAIACEGECPCASDACTEDCNSSGLVCCNGTCVNTGNDRNNCGGCGIQCSVATPYCATTGCTAPPCDSTTTCDAGQECCGLSCCSGGQICCLIMQGPWFNQCVDPVEGTCPRGYPQSVCADPDTMVATPEGERRIAEIAVGDPVYSVEGQSIVVVPVRQVRRTPVSGHRVVRVTLETGRSLALSARHPTAEGGTIGELGAGSSLDGVTVVAVELVSYEHEFTHDILPDSESGVYFASGVAIGSTLR